MDTHQRLGRRADHFAVEHLTKDNVDRPRAPNRVNSKKNRFRFRSKSMMDWNIGIDLY